MKKAVLLSVFILTGVFSLFGCKAKDRPGEVPADRKRTVTFISGADEADVWILPDTAENRSTTVWGKAMISKLSSGGSERVSIGEPGENGGYIIRVIDGDGMYYSAGFVLLSEGDSIKMTVGNSPLSVIFDVTSSDGNSAGSFTGFAAKL